MSAGIHKLPRHAVRRIANLRLVIGQYNNFQKPDQVLVAEADLCCCAVRTFELVSHFTFELLVAIRPCVVFKRSKCRIRIRQSFFLRTIGRKL